MAEPTREERAACIGAAAAAGGLAVAVAESLTGGMVASALAQAPAASEWFRGGIVAYARDVKHDLLAVPAGPVVSEQAAAAMARGARTVLHAGVAVAVTGVGGPQSQDDEPPGVLYIAVDREAEVTVQRYEVPGDDPAEVCHRAVDEAGWRRPNRNMNVPTRC
jgi:nicotinamide-nucleotide amidase